MIAPMNTAPIRAARHAPSQMGGSGMGNGLSVCSSMYPIPWSSNLYDFMVVCWLVAVDEGVEQYCRLHAEPSDGAAGDDLGEED